ncbi:MAG: TonB-dependent receptor [Pyrinomonadaceae bacterium MAG19_C2-C3]|nr:TonB-dependent receptor [Pyrinomonadaceae bacterium MAG19_C2-C3]
MEFLSLRRALVLILVGLFLFSTADTFAQTTTGTLRGQVTDPFNAVVTGATVTAIDANGTERSATTNEEGNYVIAGLAPGIFIVRVTSPGFSLFENPQVEVATGNTAPLNIQLGIALEEQEVTVAGEAPVSTEPANNADALVLRGADLDALPDDPDDLAAALQALAGPGAGPNGGQIFIDGFTGGRLPPRESIREVRINSNPFSAEFDRIGFGRIEILTKPGTDRFRGTGFFNFGDESLNSRNPFTQNLGSDGKARRAPFQLKRFGGNVSGSLIPKRASYFIDFERRDTDDNAAINARTLDASLNPVPFSFAVVTPQRRTTFSPRFDYQINSNNTLVGRYTYSRGRNENAGLSELTLPERAFDVETSQHTFQITETAIIGTAVNESRFQFVRENRAEDVAVNTPTINVLDSFVGGSPSIGFGSRNPETRVEFQNFTSFTRGKHSIKAGARLRHVRVLDVSPDNYAGTFTFTGVRSAGMIIQSPLDQFRAVERGDAGARPSQFTIAGGNPEARVRQTDFAPFVQDDWRINPALTLSLGLRYEVQSNINSNLNFAPRIGFAYSPGAGGSTGTARPRTVIRGGFGVFYERFAESLVLQTNRLNAVGSDGMLNDLGSINQLQFTVINPNFYINNIPTTQELFASVGAQGLTTRLIADDLTAPYTLQSNISIERQLFGSLTANVVYFNTRTLHVLRSRNVNAPLPASIQYDNATGRVITDEFGRPRGAQYPFGAVGNIYRYESSGIFNQNQLIVSLNSRFGQRLTFRGGYILGSARSDTDGAGSFPGNPFDLSTEYGRASFDVRHRFFFFGSYNAPFGFTFNPFITANSGRPFNITIGQDLNADTIFNDRPAFATDLTRGSVVRTEFGDFDTNPRTLPDAEIIPRNFANGPAFFSVNMRVGRNFGFGRRSDAVAQNGNAGGGGRRGGGGGRRGGRGGGLPQGAGGGGGGGFGGVSSDSRYTLNLSVQVENLFNRTNEGQPIGNLSSNRFGQSISLVTRGGGFGGGGGDGDAGNRRVVAQLRFNF